MAHNRYSYNLYCLEAPIGEVSLNEALITIGAVLKQHIKMYTRARAAILK